jgi:hypothetical protein
VLPLVSSCSFFSVIRYLPIHVDFPHTQALSDGSGAMPDKETIISTMHKLDNLLRSAEDPALLELRILARHAADVRFAFLRPNGPFRSEWLAIRATASRGSKMSPVKPAPPTGETPTTGLSSLADYGEPSDQDE